MSFLENVAFEGMRVVMTMDKEARYWGRKGPPDGAEGTLVGRQRYRAYKSRFGIDRYGFEPGVYEQDGTWLVKMDDPAHGDIEVSGVPTGIYHGSGDFDVAEASRAEYNERADKLWHIPVNREKTVSYREQEGILSNRRMVSELPESLAWERDTVILKPELQSQHEGYNLVVTEIRYSDEGGVSWYSVQAFDDQGTSGYSTGVRDEDIERVVRGDVWKHEHGEPLEFKSLEEEAWFHKGIGKYREITNPSSGLYKWTLDEFLAAVSDDLVDCMSNGAVPFTNTRSISAYRFHDRKLGERLRQETIKGFEIDAAKLSETALKL
jgi:hypothetical protein